jgi:hypothetical protein
MHSWSGKAKAEAKAKEVYVKVHDQLSFGLHLVDLFTHFNHFTDFTHLGLTP